MMIFMSFAPILLNLVNLPFVLLFQKFRGKSNFIVGLNFIALFYVYFFYMFSVISFTRNNMNTESFTQYIAWFFCFTCCIGPIYKISDVNNREAIEFGIFNGTKEYDIKVLPTQIASIFSFIFFFVTVFYPDIFEVLYFWIF